MSREIKFRVWDVKSQEMRTVFRADWHPNIPTPYTVVCGTADDGHMVSKELWNGTEGVFSPDFIIMQYTGLKDKDGVEIYEGDILESDNPNCGYGNPKEKEMVHYPVSWSNDEACFQWGDLLMDLNMACLKVIGNIHQHPELLEK